MMKSLPKSRNSSWRIPVCDRCEKRNPGMIVLQDELWAEITENRREIICLSCIEKALGRSITFEDLKECAVTQQMAAGAMLTLRKLSPETLTATDFLREY